MQQTLRCVFKDWGKCGELRRGQRRGFACGEIRRGLQMKPIVRVGIKGGGEATRFCLANASRQGQNQMCSVSAHHALCTRAAAKCWSHPFVARTQSPALLASMHSQRRPTSRTWSTGRPFQYRRARCTCLASKSCSAAVRQL